MNDVLQRIVAATRERIAGEPADRAGAERMAAARRPFEFSAALRRDGVNVIAEVKSGSPSAGLIVADPDVEGITGDYARGGAAAVSIVTEPEFFRGSRAWIGRARTAGLPVIMKDFVVAPSQIVNGIAAGADAVLLLASLLEGPRIAEFIGLLDAYGCDALVEVHDEKELSRAIGGGARLVGVNNRNLRDFSVDLGTSERLAALMPQGVVRVAESGIRTVDDVRRLRAAGFHGFLVGESLLRQQDRAAAVAALCTPAGRGPQPAATAPHSLLSTQHSLLLMPQASCPMPRIKICGITREQDALFAARAGADFLGFIFAPESPRYVEPARARAIAEAVRATGAATKIVGVFRNATPGEVNAAAAVVALDLVQLHGSEDDEFVAAIGVPVVKTIHVADRTPGTAAWPHAAWLLFDTAHDRLAGGTGKRFDWSLLGGCDRATPFFLSGGITPENAAAAVSAVRPDAIDVASGVESSPGIKDHEKIEQLFERVTQG